MLRVFAEVARAGSLVVAAERLGRVPSALSTSLKQLEDHLGSPLFVGERKAQLTPLGRHTLEVATKELAQLDRSIASLMAFATAEAGEIRVASVPSFATTLLPGLVKDFLEQRPAVRMEIYDIDSEAIRRALQAARVDLGILSGGEETAELLCHPLAADPYGLVMREDHPFAQQQAVALPQLLETSFIVNPLCRHITQSPMPRLQEEAKLHVQNTATLLAMVRAGLGVTLLPRLVAKQASTRIVFRPLAERIAARRLNLLMPAESYTNPATAAFASFLVARRAEIGVALSER